MWALEVSGERAEGGRVAGGRHVQVRILNTSRLFNTRGPVQAWPRPYAGLKIASADLASRPAWGGGEGRERRRNGRSACRPARKRAGTERGGRGRGRNAHACTHARILSTRRPLPSRRLLPHRTPPFVTARCASSVSPLDDGRSGKGEAAAMLPCVCKNGLKGGIQVASAGGRGQPSVSRWSDESCD